MADATFTDVAYQLMRVYRNKNYIADLSFGQDALYGQLKQRTIKVVGGQADMVTTAFDGAGVPSNVIGTSGTTTPSVGVQFAVTPIQLTNLAGLNGIAAAGGASAGALVKPLKREIDMAIKKTVKHGAIQLWQDGFPALGTVVTAGASTTLTVGDLTATGVADKNFTVNFSKGDRLVFAQTRNSGALRAGVLTVQKVNQNAGTLVVDANVNGVASSNDFIFLENTRNTGATVIALSGLQAWLPSSGGTLFGVDTTQDDRLIGLQVSASASDIEGAFIDGIATLLQFSDKGAEDIKAFMTPATWAVLAKAMQSKQVVTVTPTITKARYGAVSFSGWRVMTPNGTIEVFTSRFAPKNKIMMLNLSTWELVSWGVPFPTIIPPALGAGPPIFQDPATGSIKALVGGYPQLECNAPGYNLTITLT